MSKVSDIKELYEQGWWPNQVETCPWPNAVPTPDWAKALQWNYSLWTPEPGKELSETLTSYCQGFLEVPPDKQINGPDGSPYLSKWCIAEPHGARNEDLSGKIYLHRFHRGDADRQLHNHPWASSLSLILLNGYKEERRALPHRIRGHIVRAAVHRFVRNPGDVVEVDRDTFHRVDLINGDAWTLFFVGPCVGTWHFWDRETGQLEQWEDFLRARGRLP